MIDYQVSRYIGFYLMGRERIAALKEFSGFLA
jgi:hypothetical protein